MKKIIIAIFVSLIITVSAFAEPYWYNATSVLGSATASLDSINGQNLINGDKAIVVTASGMTYIYNLDSQTYQLNMLLCLFLSYVSPIFGVRCKLKINPHFWGLSYSWYNLAEHGVPVLIR